MRAHPTRRAFLARGGAGLASLALFDLLAACGGSSTTGGGQSSTRSHLTVGIIQEPTSLDLTADATNSIGLLLRDNVYEGLVRLDPRGKVLPGLARSWDVSSDGTTFTFHLATGVKWHDGSPFTASDVQFSWERAMSLQTRPINPHVDYWAPVRSVARIDDRTVRVVLKQYSFNWLFHMTAASAAIVSEKTITGNAAHPVGTGPFTFTGWDRGANLRLARHDAYWGTGARLSSIEFRFITDANAMNNALLAGDIDAIGQLGGPEQISTFEKDSRFRVLRGVPAGKVIVAINNASRPLKDARVRRAISMAIDRKAWIQGILSGYGVPIGSHSVPNAGEPYYVNTTDVNPYDTSKARSLLQQAGYGSGLTLRLAQISDFPYAVRGTDILNSELKQIGITVKVTPMPFASWYAQVFSPTGPQDYDLTIINHAEERDIGNYADPKYYWHYANTEVAQWLLQADAEVNQARRNDLYAQVQRQLATDAANGFIMSPNQLAVVRSTLHGYPATSLMAPLFLGAAYFS